MYRFDGIRKKFGAKSSEFGRKKYEKGENNRAIRR